MKKPLLIFLSLILLSCGYRIAGFNDGPVIKDKFYITDIKNLTFESSYGSILNSTVYDFFNKHNLLAQKKGNNVELSIIMTDINFENKILQESNRATSSELVVKIKISAFKNGKLLMEKSYSNANKYIIYTNITDTLQSRKEALIKGINNILLNFLNDYEKEINSNR